ncbi:hypothetical protein Q2K19_31355 [Micromonospora soli]|uniref:hypothetical protein n=1 Tax=Micromonospora sp. NBRC 110009 TaxID=3061627 RepID=UPI00267156CE|nr:hypothetical protein [Micromonospora sp. NBRC 110009]WKT98591.1 hypothetical protein Q2K19_31355 [Micromonospora sp. NBRC 110009]
MTTLVESYLPKRAKASCPTPETDPDRVSRYSHILLLDAEVKALVASAVGLWKTATTSSRPPASRMVQLRLAWPAPADSLCVPVVSSGALVDFNGD